MSTHAINNARAHLSSICAANCALQWLHSNRRSGNDLTADARALLRDYGWDGEDVSGAEEAIEQAMREAPLSLDVRSGWQGAGETLEPAEFQLMLSTGGPALRLIGDLTDSYDACDCRLQWQDWGEPWTDLPTTGAERDALEWFAELFTLSLPY